MSAPIIRAGDVSPLIAAKQAQPRNMINNFHRYQGTNVPRSAERFTKNLLTAHRDYSAA
jgi:hypothetical protein